MRPILRRIAVQGGLAAVLLGVVGLLFAELASIWLAGSPGTRDATGDPLAPTDADGSVAGSLRTRIPLVMAIWGFAFVAAGEVVLHLWRGGRPRPVKSTLAPPDDAEKLLEELLRQAEAAPQLGVGDRGEGTEPPRPHADSEPASGA